MHGEYRGQVGDRWFTRRVPITNDCAFGTQHVELWLTSSSEIGMDKSCLLAGRKCHGDMRVVSVRCVGPYALVVLPTHVCDVIWDDVQNLIDEMTAPVENCTT